MTGIDWWAFISSPELRNAVLSVGGILAIFAYGPKAVPKISAALRWLWRKSRSLFTWVAVVWHRWRARAIVEREMQIIGDFFIAIDTYRQYLAKSPAGSGHVLRTYFRDVPVWLNDYYVTTAMEALAAKGRLVKATIYIQDYNWPPREARYLFRHTVFVTSPSVAAEVKRIETDNMCVAYQRHLMMYTANRESCFVGARFESEGYSQTISRREVSHGVRMKLNEGAPPCERCWELNEQKMGLSELVVQFLKTELGEVVEPFSAIKEEYQGNDSIRPSYPNGWQPGTFLGTIVEHCVDTGIGYEEIKPALEITRRAVAIHARHCKEQTDRQVNIDELKRELKDAKEENLQCSTD